MNKSKIVQANEKIVKNVAESYHKIEEGVVTGYKKMEEGVVDGFNRISDKFVEKIFAKEGETVEEAKKRLAHEQDAGEEE